MFKWGIVDMVKILQLAFRAMAAAGSRLRALLIAVLALWPARALQRAPQKQWQRRRRLGAAKGFGGGPAKKSGKKKARARAATAAPAEVAAPPPPLQPAAPPPPLWPLRVLHADGAGAGRAFGVSPAAVGWDRRAPPATRAPVDGVPGAFLLRNALTPGECRRLVDLAEAAGFEEGGDAAADDDRDQRNGAVSLALDLSPVFERCRSAFPDRILSYRYAGGGDRYEKFDDEAPRRLCPGAPEGSYEVEGLNPRGRFYRYRPGSGDVFRPHRDDVWPGSSLVRTTRAPPGLPFDAVAEDGWAYAADHKSPWAFRRGVDRVSQLTVLLYLNDDFAGGETTFFDDDGLPPVAVKPEAGAALCFWQSFKLGRNFRCRDSAHAHLHEGSPVRPGSGSPKYAVRTEVLYTFPDQGEPPA